jgi:hypothetical protein
LGRHSKPSRIRLPQAASTAAGPTLAGVAAAICLAPQASAAAAVVPVAHTATQPTAHRSTVPAAYQRRPSPAQLIAATRQAKTPKHRSGVPSTYTVRPGDSLSSIAGRVYHNPAAWPVLYWRNHAQVRWANIITTGQVLRIPAEPARIPRAPKLLEPAQTAVHYTPRHASPGPEQAAPVTQAPVAATTTVAGGYPGGAFGQCVVARESGGNPQVMNASGHYGLYQFSASTWAAYGGNPADFGNASVAEQNQVFANALAAGGQSNWAPYDGC